VRRNPVALVFFAWLLLGTLACSLFGPSRAEMPSLHALGWSGPAPAPRPSGAAPTLLIGIPRAGPGFDSPRMAYATEPHALAYFARHQWVDTPARMLQPLLARAAESTGCFAAVVQAPTSVAATLRLDTEVVELVQDFSFHPSLVRVALRVQLVEVDARRVVATRDVVVAVPASSDDPPGGVVAANRAMEAALGEVAALCANDPPG
jgi:cholesterol transport system auxiliary component